MTVVNPNSQRLLTDAKFEPALADAAEGEGFQFIRQGYFTLDRDSTKSALIFNQTVSLKEGWTAS
jgi:glutaminyl-tRNA synthetase